MLAIPFTFRFDHLETGQPAARDLDLPNINGIVDSYDHASADKFGYESASVSFNSSLADGAWMLSALGRQFTVYDPYGIQCWQGIIHSITLRASGIDHTISLEKLANRIRVRFTTPFGTNAVSSTASDTTSQARYGVKDLVQSGGAKTKTEADALATRLLKELTIPPSNTAVAVAAKQERETACAVTLNCVGLYETLAWAVTSNTSTSQSETTAQATALLSATPNDWISAGRITASGLNASQFIAQDTTYRAKLEELLELGMSDGTPLSWGVYNDRQLEVVPFAGVNVGSAPIRRLSTSTQEPIIRNADGSEVLWWRVRPNYAYSSDLLDDGSAKGVVGRVSFRCDTNGMSLSLEGTDRSSADALIARTR